MVKYNYSFPKVPKHSAGMHFCWRHREGPQEDEKSWYWQKRLYVQLTDKSIVFLSCPIGRSDNDIVRSLWEIPLDGSAESDEVILSLFPDFRTPKDIQEPKSNSQKTAEENEEGAELWLREILPPFLVCLFRVDTYEFRNPLADQVREKVLASPMLSAIYRKENYRWLREQYEQSLTGERDHGEQGTAFWRRYGAAEREWFAFCSDRAHEHLFGRAGWLDYVENEVQVISYFRSIPLFPVPAKKCEEGVPIESDVAVVGTSNEKSQEETTTYVPFRQMIRFHLYRVRKLAGPPVSEHNEGCRTPEASAVAELVFVDHMHAGVVYWYLRRYDLNSVFVMLWVKMLCSAAYVFQKSHQRSPCLCDDDLCPNWLSFVSGGIVVILAGAVCAVGLSLFQFALPFSCVLSVLSVCRVLAISLFVLYAVCVARSICWTRSGEVSHTTLGYSLVQSILYRPLSVCLLMCLGFILVAILAGLYSQDKWFAHCGRMSIYVVVFSLMCVVMLAVANLALSAAGWGLFKGSQTRYPRGWQFLLVIQTCLPRLMFGMIGGWIALVGAGELWKPFMLTDHYDFVCIGFPLLCLAVLLAMVEINNQVDSLSRSFWRATCLVTVTFILSCLVGFVMYCLSMEHLIYHDQSFSPIQVEERSAPVLPCLRLSPRLVQLLESKRISDSHLRRLPPTTSREDVWSLLTQLYWADSSNEARVDAYVKTVPSLSSSGIISNANQQNVPSRRCSGLPVRYAYCLESDGQGGRHVYILPGLVLQFSCFAVFIAVALQLIFEDKRITEPI